MAQTVIGIFDNSSEAQQAVQELKRIGLSDSNIDVSSASSSSSSSSSSYGSGSSASGSTYDSSTSSSSSDNDGIGGFFRSLFSDDDDSATRYSNVARHSDCIVTVHAQTDEEARRAAIILDQYGSVDVDQRASEYGYGSFSGSSYTGGTGSTYGAGTGSTYGSGTGLTGTSDSLTGSGTGSGSDTYAGGADSTYAGSTNNTVLSDSTSDYTGTTDTTRNDLTDSTSIPIIEENLQVGKREVETGGARLRSRIVERPVEEHLRLRSEHVRVERHAVNRPATEADFNSFKEGEIELIEHAEVPVVSKEARVVEEVSLGKEVEERDEVIRDTVRSTEVDVDNLTGTSDTTRTGLDTDLDSDLDRNRQHRGLTDLDNNPNTAI